MTITNDGGQAFPSTYSAMEFGDIVNKGEAGMSLRDYFAGQALAGILPHPETVLNYRSDISSADRGLARTAYRIADAMLAARGAA